MDWFDRSLWKQSGSGEFCNAVDPVELLEKTPDILWPGLMPCDFLPLIGNDAGDWLGVHVDAQNQASEIRHWYHGGGDWIPWGRTLAEAILFASVSDRLPGPHRRHAIPAEPIRPSDSEGPWLAWALRHLPAAMKATTDSLDGPALADLFLQHGVAEVAVRCELVQHALSESLTETLNPKLADQLGVDPGSLIQWTFDQDRMPQDVHNRLTKDFDWQPAKQDWQTAAKHCQAVTAIAPQLGWAWDVLAYSLERSGETQQAIQAYRQAAKCSVFTDQSIRLRTHWESVRSGKFSVARLSQLDPELAQRDAFIQAMLVSDPEARRIAVTEHWLGKAAKVSEQPAVAVEHMIAAGWDLGADPMSVYGSLLQQIAETADAANQTARARVAETHRMCLKERYGV